MTVSRVRERMIFLLLLAAGLMLSGCFQSSGAADSAQRAVGDSPSSPGGEPALTFGIIYPMVNATYEMITAKAEAAASKHNVSLLVQAPDEANLEQQIRIMEMMIKRGVDGIAIAPVDSQALAGVINKAVSQGIPVVCFESDSPGSKREAYIGADNRATGAVIGQTVERLLDGKGMILVESGMSRMQSTRERLLGLEAYLTQHTEIDVLDIRHNDGSEELAALQLEQMISDHPHFSALVNLDFVSSSSSVLVWKAKGLKRYNIALGLTPALKQAVDNGQITRVISQNEQNWGEDIINALLLRAQGLDAAEWINTEITIIGE
ncbi:substrate-binding domain-containing protein [Paenibacillus tritici]|uniref:sugar ABC transporter substrate-binding protein n=1 Tax=Paenibacillus tritici TaxID=1873425 RepID=UPI001BA4A5ED|nr:substrate-binding domain-containing protein [Paenibacillus tritici]QUL57179.1 substrate-binding domain-containing protein [Paenibacillus tritici]